jgi:hypothetical protein
MGTRVFRSQPADIDSFSLAEWGDDLGRDASGRERKLDFVLQVVIPAESLFFGSVGVHDGFVLDTFFANAILARLGQEKLDSMISASGSQTSASVYLLKTLSIRSQSWSSCSCRTLFLA